MAPKMAENQSKWGSSSGERSSPHLNARSSVPSEAGKSSSSQLFTNWLQKRSRKSSSSGGETEVDAVTNSGTGRGRFFPAKLAQALGMAKCLLGLLLVAFGALALWERAAMSNLGSGEHNTPVFH
jgi:hypothetical protein